ncbi:PEP-CTERM sorting domain-containing protein [Colwellia sp. BRX9-1]|uniref:PEP-CTERM sorting domain-containing protein n=1 Tax=Colwellia sp. BRX9-1 TaxID=2759830 RepID=UPI0015F678B9|nr:PEP-CTERM sorting domain-containing protein [Colwellia sp. BRX9-1]MBA6351583.1 PEP-CTERM sorting domain-containing protein [Colwellia sp. BRX9-1]
MQNHQIIKKRIFTLLLLVTAMAVFMPKSAATTIILDFTTIDSTDMYGAKTNAFDESIYGFSNMGLNDVINNISSAISNDFFGYSYAGLSAGKELNINFEVGTIGSGPSNGDNEFSYFQFGNVTSGESHLGHACSGCALTSYWQGKVIGSIFTNNIATDLARYATNNKELINLIAGTASHEIGHSLFLSHPGGKELNPGESDYGLMATGASQPSMPNEQRVLDRAFSNRNFDTLITRVGLRDAQIAAIPEPSTILLLLSALLMLIVKRKKY